MKKTSTIFAKPPHTGKGFSKHLVHKASGNRHTI